MEEEDIQKLLQHSRQAAPMENAYSNYMNFMFVLSTILTFLSLYLFINRRSKLHPELISMFFHSMITSYVLTVTITLWQFIVMPPYVGGYPNGWIFKKIGPYSFLVGIYICWSCVVHLGVTYTLAFSLQCYRMKVAARKIELNRTSVIFNFAFTAIPIISLAWFTMPVEKEPLLVEIRKQHPEIILCVIRENTVFLISVLVCSLIISLEMFYCIKTNWSTRKIIQKTSKTLTQKTHSMQLLMYRLFCLQLFMIVLFYYLPTVVASLHMLEIIDLQNFSTINICVMVWHCPAQAIVSLIGYPEIREKIGLISQLNRQKETMSYFTPCLLRLNSTGVLVEKCANSVPISNLTSSSDLESCPPLIINVDY